MQLSTRIEKYDVWKRKSPTLKSSMPRSAEEAWKRACPPTLRNREALSTLSTVHVRIFKHSATGVLLHTRTHKYDHVLWCGATLPHLSHYKEEACDNAVIYFIAPSLRLVWWLPLCTSLSVYISRQILSSRRLGFRERAPLFTHTSHVCACASFVSMGRCCQMSFSFKPFMGFFGFRVLVLWAELKCLWISHSNCFHKNIHINAWLPSPNIYGIYLSNIITIVLAVP